MKRVATLVAVGLCLLCTAARADDRAQQLTAEGWSALKLGAAPEAQVRFERALQLDPNAASAWAGLGDALFWQHEFRAAVSAFERANELAPHAHTWTGLGSAYVGLATRFFELAEQRRALLGRASFAFQRALALDPSWAAARGGLVIAEHARRQPGAPPLALSWVVALSLLVLAAAALQRIAQSPRATRVTDARAVIAAVAAPYLLTRAIVLLAFWLAPRWLEQQAGVEPVLVSSDNPILRAAAERWDANLYVNVALNGYDAGPLWSGHWGLLGQLPLLPVLYRFTMHGLGDPHWSALVLPHLALLLAAGFFYFWVRDNEDPATAQRAVWALMLLPGSLFGSALYAEAIAMACLIAAQAHVQKGRGALSLLSGMLAGMARINALAAVPMLALAAWSRARTGSRWVLCALLGPPLGLLVFMLYTHFAFGDAFAYFHELRAHRFTGQGAAPTLRDVKLLVSATWNGTAVPIGDSKAVGWLGVACLLAYAWAGADLLHKRRLPEASFVLAGVLLALGSNLISQPRYLWLLFPAYISFARLGRVPFVRYAAAAALALVLFLEALAYAAFYFVT